MKRAIALLFVIMASPAAHAFPSYASGDGFRGAELMTPEERQAHVARMQSFHTFDECETYTAAHEAELQKRAAERHVTLPPKNTVLFDGDPCKVMRFMGRIK
ncbi:hypothetical protein EZJ19_05985 [Parasulfuritortus cantonensis]|uniref:Uncharacterized protein n=1 Tax=Parasulfuritortus cantonensis TaxID=2528202 RepID=A0A4R1BFF6_9PROT|nr:hypothetical protein [Parasulfuritortus cantonensis]TCJ15768.1 hypothetical protein EZJ19_05985 [Parasulfuritortus cantonensis]